MHARRYESDPAGTLFVENTIRPVSRAMLRKNRSGGDLYDQDPHVPGTVAFTALPHLCTDVLLPPRAHEIPAGAAFRRGRRCRRNNRGTNAAAPSDRYTYAGTNRVRDHGGLYSAALHTLARTAHAAADADAGADARIDRNRRAESRTVLADLVFGYAVLCL